MGKPNSQILYDIFGEFSQEDSADVKLHTLDLISQEIDLYEKVGTTYLLLLGISMESWLNMMLRKTSFADELMLYALSRSYNRHTIVYNKNRLWCTMDITRPLTATEIHNHCDVHLVYITGGLFAQLRRKPDTLLLPVVLSSSTLEQPMDMSITGPPTQDLIIKPKNPSDQNTPLENVHVEITVSSSGTIEDIVTNLDPDVDSTGITESRVLVNPPTNIDFSSIVVPTTSSVTDQTDQISNPIGVNVTTRDHNVAEKDVVPGSDGSIVANVDDVNNFGININQETTTGVNGLPTQSSATIGANNVIASNVEPELIEVLSSEESDSTIIYEVPNAARLAELDKIATFCRRTPGERFLEMYKTADERVVQALHKSTLDRKCRVVLKPVSSLDLYHWLNKSALEQPKPKLSPLDEINEELQSHLRQSRYPKRIRVPRRIRSSGRALRKTAQEQSYLESGSSGNESINKWKRENPDPGKREPSLARLFAQKLIDLKHGKKPKSSSSPSPHASPPGSSPDHNMHKPPRPKPIDKTKQRTQRPKNRKPELKVKNKTGKNYFKIQPTARVLRKYTRKRVYKCPFPNCSTKRDNLSSLNAHYRIKHPPLACSKCNKKFSTPSTLSKHFYNHGELKYSCHTCGKKYAFKSQLTNHRISHKRTKDHVCIWPNCGKSYFSKGELTKHTKIHYKDTEFCHICDYSTYDSRLLLSHLRKHNKKVKKYECKNCGERFTHHTQRQRHVRDNKCRKRSNSPSY